MRAAPVIVSSAVLAIVAVGVGVAVAQPSDDAVEVGAVSVGDVTVDDDPTASDGPTVASTTTGPSPTGTSSPSSTPSGSPQQVAGLDTVQGVLTRDDSSGSDSSDDSDDSDGSDDSDDRAELEVAGVDLELGPESWLLTAGPVADFDGDGTLSPVLEELDALVGQEVTVLGRLDDDGDDIEVYEIQGLTFRTSTGPAPWQDAGAGDALSQDEIVQVALEAVGAGSRLDSVDTEDDGGSAWEVEVYDAKGDEQRVLLDEVGTVLDIRPED